MKRQVVRIAGPHENPAPVPVRPQCLLRWWTPSISGQSHRKLHLQADTPQDRSRRKPTQRSYRSGTGRLIPGRGVWQSERSGSGRSGAERPGNGDARGHRQAKQCIAIACGMLDVQAVGRQSGIDKPRFPVGKAGVRNYRERHPDAGQVGPGLFESSPPPPRYTSTRPGSAAPGAPVAASCRTRPLCSFARRSLRPRHDPVMQHGRSPDVESLDPCHTRQGGHVRGTGGRHRRTDQAADRGTPRVV